jgi:hypothetical protein
MPPDRPPPILNVTANMSHPVPVAGDWFSPFFDVSYAGFGTYLKKAPIGISFLFTIDFDRLDTVLFFWVIELICQSCCFPCFFMLFGVVSWILGRKP